MPVGGGCGSISESPAFCVMGKWGGKVFRIGHESWGRVMGDKDKRLQADRKKDRAPRDPFIRAENEDDDGYDPYSDRRPEPEPLFERDPWY